MSDLTWTVISKYPKTAQDAIAKYREAEAKAVKAKQEAIKLLNRAMQEKGIVPDGMEAKYSFRFGRVSFALDTPRKATTKAERDGLDLS